MMIASILITGAWSFAWKYIIPERNIITMYIHLTINVFLIFSVFYFWTGRKYKNVFYNMFSKKIKFSFFYRMIPSLIGTTMINKVIGHILTTSKDDTYYVMLSQIAANKSYIVFFMITIAFIAPFTEELVFRGIILKGLASRYSPLKAILITSFLFSVFHLNLTQIPNAFILGFIFSIITIHSRNILYSVFYHIINNFLATLLLFFITPEEILNKTSNISHPSPLALFIWFNFGIFFIYIGLKLMLSVISEDSKSIIPSRRIYRKYIMNFKEKENE